MLVLSDPTQPAKEQGRGEMFQKAVLVCGGAICNWEHWC